MKKLIIYFLFVIMAVNLAGCGNLSAKNENVSISEESIDSREENSSEDENISEEDASDENVEESASEEETKETAGAASVTESSQEEKNTGNDENSKKVIVIDPGHASHSNLEKEEQSPDSGIMKIKDGEIGRAHV